MWAGFVCPGWDGRPEVHVLCSLNSGRGLGFVPSWHCMDSLYSDWRSCVWWERPLVNAYSQCRSRFWWLQVKRLLINCLRSDHFMIILLKWLTELSVFHWGSSKCWPRQWIINIFSYKIILVFLIYMKVNIIIKCLFYIVIYLKKLCKCLPSGLHLHLILMNI